jgi:hypothetical protein
LCETLIPLHLGWEECHLVFTLSMPLSSEIAQSIRNLPVTHTHTARSRTQAHARAHTHARMHTRKNNYTHSSPGYVALKPHTHTHRNTHIQTRTHTHKQLYTHTHSHKHTRSTHNQVNTQLTWIPCSKAAPHKGYVGPRVHVIVSMPESRSACTPKAAQQILGSMASALACVRVCVRVCRC